MALCGPLFLTSKSIIIAILSPRLFDHVLRNAAQWYTSTPATAEHCPFPTVSARRCDRFRWHFVGRCSSPQNQLSSLSCPQPDVCSIKFCENETAETPATAEHCPFPTVSAKPCDRLRWHFVGRCSSPLNQL